MTTLKWATPAGVQTYLTTELNALANGANKIGAEVNNESGLNMYVEFELYVAEQGAARSAGAYVALYCVKDIGGSGNYGYGADALNPASADLIEYFRLDAATTARYVTLSNLVMPPCKCKFLVQNVTGRAFASTDNTLKYRLFNAQAA